MSEDGKKVGRPPTSEQPQIRTRISHELLDRLERAAKADGRSRDNWVIMAIIERLERQGR